MDAADIQKRMRAHMVAFVAILVMAFVAAGSVLAGVTSPYLVSAIAAAQAAIILSAMMHARAEGFWVKSALVSAVFFVVVLLGLMMLGHRSTIVGTERIQPIAAPAEASDTEAH